MKTIEHIIVNSVPILHVVKQRLHRKPLPTVIYYHGFNGEKESSLTIAYKMAEKGLRVILPDAPLHGERNNYADEPIEHGDTFWEIVLQTIDELDNLKKFLYEKNFVLDDKIGLGGTSMGGMITYAALSKFDWVKTAAVLMGSPYLTKRAENTLSSNFERKEELLKEIRPLDISENLNSLNERPLFIWHGEKDAIVPVTDSREFYQTVTNVYADKNKIVFIEEKDRIHNISKYSIKKVAEWFYNQL
jgi:fermentation-respiration switch protein FrsA (DUF1100 family)